MQLMLGLNTTIPDCSIINNDNSDNGYDKSKYFTINKLQANDKMLVANKATMQSTLEVCLNYSKNF